MGCLSVFNPSRHLILSFIYFFFSLMFSLLIFLLFSLSLSLSLSIFQIWLQERLRLLQPPTVPLSTHLPRHLKDCQLHQNDMSFEAYMELMGHLKDTDIQRIVKWWHISSMVHSCCKDCCVTLVGLRSYSYYSTCCISRQFGEHQGTPYDEGAFHTTVFTNRILGRISKAWPRCRMTKGIIPP